MALKAIKTLIRVHRRELDELRRKMVALENQKDQLQQLSRRLSEELRDESERAASMPEMAAFMVNFTQSIGQRQEVIALGIRDLDRQMDTLRDDIAAKFGEVKKYEIVRDNWIKRDKQAAERKEALQMDEVAIQQFIRQEEES